MKNHLLNPIPHSSILREKKKRSFLHFLFLAKAILIMLKIVISQLSIV
jgi:hypothetical protein